VATPARARATHTVSSCSAGVPVACAATSAARGGPLIGRARRRRDDSERIRGLIWRVGGLCWLLVTGTALLTMLPASGTTVRGMYLATTQARATQHLLALAVAAFSPIALALAAGLIDRHAPGMYETLDSWAPLSAHWESWVMALRLFLPPYVLGLCAIALLLVVRGEQREALRAAELASACSAARMAMLTAQLQPHFLFNALHAISVLIDNSPRRRSRGWGISCGTFSRARAGRGWMLRPSWPGWKPTSPCSRRASPTG
jgi:Histidine kinase